MLRRLALVVAIALTGAAGIAVAAVAGSRVGVAVEAIDSTGGSARRVPPSPSTAPTTVPPTTTTTSGFPTVAASAGLPVPEPSPADPYADVPVVQIGRVSIPRIGLDHPIFEGVWLTVIDYGPAHWTGSALPGQRGNAVFAGHRVTHSHPFYDLDLLVPGDEVTFHMPDGDFTYAVTGTQIVVPTDLWITEQTPSPTMTLFACHPKGSARQRIVVKGDLVRSTPSLATVAGALDASDRVLALPL